MIFNVMRAFGQAAESVGFQRPRVIDYQVRRTGGARGASLYQLL